MGTTSLVLRLQSDQILDGPTIGTTLNLKNLTDTRRLQLVWVQPAVDPTPLLFKDPGALPAPVGTVSVVNGSAAVVGSGTTFLTTFSNGQAVSFGNQPDIVYLILNRASNTSLTLTTNFSGVTNGSTTINQAGADAVVYENLAQAFKNKDLSDPSNIAPFDPTVAHLPGQAGGQTLNGGTAASENLTLRSTANVTKGLVKIDLDDLEMGAGKNILFSANGEPKGLPTVPTGATSAASKAYVDNQISMISGGSGVWREVLLSQVQLDTPNKAIAQATAFYFATAAANNGNTFVITDGVNTETYTFQAVSGFRQPTPGVSAAQSQTNLVAKINSDSAFWLAQEFPNLQSINPSANTVVLWRRIPTSTVNDRIYGTITGATVTYVNYGGLLDYRSSTTAALPGADPATATFGISRVTVALLPDEAHLVRAEDAAWIWNSDAGTWQLTAGAVTIGTSAPLAGGTLGEVSGDESNGIHILGPGPGEGAIQVKVDGSSVSFNGSGQLQVAGGAVPLGTSAPAAGGTPGKVSGDESSGIHITGAGALQAKVDGVSMVFDGSGNLRSTPVAQIPTGTVSIGALLTQNIPAVTAPTSVFVATDIPAQNYPHLTVTGQLMDFTVPDDYDSGPLTISAVYEMVTPGAAGNIRQRVQAKIVKSLTGTVDTTTFPSTDSTVTPVVTSSFFQRLTLLTITNGTFSRGDTIQFYFTRVGNNIADTDTRGFTVVAFEVSYTGQVATRLSTQVADVFGSVPSTGLATPPAGTISTDIPTLDFSGTVDQAAACYFIVPDQWDGISDCVIRCQYAMAAPGTAGNVGLSSIINIADPVGGGVTSLTPTTFVIAVSGTAIHRSAFFAQIPAASLTKGSLIEVGIRRDTSTPSNSTSTFQLINVTAGFGVFPVVGFQTSTQGLLGQAIFGNFSGTVAATIDYPNIGAGEYQSLANMSSTSAAGRVDAAFQGILQSGQTQINQISVPLKGTGASPQYHILVYVEGTVGTVFDSGLTAAPGSLTNVNIPGASLSAQPTANGRYLVVAQAFIDSGEALLVGRPTFQQQ